MCSTRRNECLPTDPRQWSEAAVAAWLQWAIREFSLEGVAMQPWQHMNGKQICAMDKESFLARAPVFMGDILWEHLEILQKGTYFVKFCFMSLHLNSITIRKRVAKNVSINPFVEFSRVNFCNSPVIRHANQPHATSQPDVKIAPGQKERQRSVPTRPVKSLVSFLYQ